MNIYDNYRSFHTLQTKLTFDLVHRARRVAQGEWQSQVFNEEDPRAYTLELEHVVLTIPVPTTADELRRQVRPNLPWAEDHFLERISGEPLNPPPSHEWWPYAQQGNAEHRKGEQFSHTYPERFWPKFANNNTGNRGIRYNYGDLADVVDLLRKNPQSRQAYLPVWFPEDTGVVHGERVPCTLGYHFLSRRGKVDCTYFIRSCDFLRHFQDDVYMAARLLQFISQYAPVGEPGDLIMHISSLHTFQGDMPKLEEMLK